MHKKALVPKQTRAHHKQASPSDRARALLREDTGFFTVDELQLLLSRLNELEEDRVLVGQLLSDVVTYPYYDALAMWLDTGQWMAREDYRRLCLDLLERERGRDRPLVLTDRALGRRWRALVERGLTGTTGEIVLARLALAEAGWWVIHGDGKPARAALRVMLGERLADLERRGSCGSL